MPRLCSPLHSPDTLRVAPNVHSSRSCSSATLAPPTEPLDHYFWIHGRTHCFIDLYVFLFLDLPRTLDTFTDPRYLLPFRGFEIFAPLRFQFILSLFHCSCFHLHVLRSPSPFFWLFIAPRCGLTLTSATEKPGRVFGGAFSARNQCSQCTFRSLYAVLERISAFCSPSICWCGTQEVKVNPVIAADG